MGFKFVSKGYLNFINKKGSKNFSILQIPQTKLKQKS